MKDVIIVGGGLKGMLTALFLHDAGLKVMVLDQHELGRESSWAGGGLVSPLYPWRSLAPVSALARYSQQHYPALCKRLSDETNIDSQWVRSGLLVTDAEDVAAAQTWAGRWGYALQWLEGPAGMQACEPMLAGNFRHGLFLPELGQVRSPRLSAAVKASLHRRPILISEHQPVTGLHIEAGRVAGVYLGDELFHAGSVVMATGAWTGSFPQLASAGMQLRPVMAQSVMFRTEPGLLQRIVVDGNRYLIPRQDGRIVCGAVLSEGMGRQLTDAARDELRATACKLVPALDKLPVHNHWNSLLSHSADGIPYIGEHPEVAGLYVNAGHGNHGIATGLASVQLLVDQILGRNSCVDGAAYRLGR